MAEPLTTQPMRARVERELLVPLLLLVLAFSMSGVVDADLPGHLRFGLDHLREGTLPRHDPYAYSPGASDLWVNHEWLFELLMAWVWRVDGARGLVLLQLCGWSLASVLALRLIRRATHDFLPTALSFLTFAYLAYASIAIRPQLATFVAFALLLTLLEEARLRRRLGALVYVGLLFGLWVNLHGGFLAGLGVLGLYALGLCVDARFRPQALQAEVRCVEEGAPPCAADPPAGQLAESRAWLVGGTLLACLAAGLLTFLNPYGSELHAFLLGSLSKPRPMISEWGPLKPGVQGGVFVLFALAVFVAMGRRLRRAPVPSAHLLVLLVTAALSVRHSRHVPFFALAAVAFASGALADLYRVFVAPPPDDLEPEGARRVRGIALLVLGPAIALSLLQPARTPFSLRVLPDAQTDMPTGAVEYMREEGIEGNLLAYFDWAQLMIWEFGPRVSVFYDGRFRTVFSDELEQVYFRFLAQEEQPGWRQALDAYPTEWVLLPAEAYACARMRAQADWRVAYEDQRAVLFRRAEAGSAPPVQGADPPPALPFVEPSAGSRE